MASTYELIVQATDKTSGPLRKVERGLGKVEKSTNAVNKALKAAGGAIIAFASAKAIGGIIDVSRAFTKQIATLQTYTGSVEKAEAQLSNLVKTANSVGMSTEDMTEAFLLLKSRGIDASGDSLVAWSNIAAATGKSIGQLGEAVADALTGEFERLKEFGIKVSKESDKVTATLADGSQIAANSYKELVQQLKALGQEGGTYFGAAERQANTFDGAVVKLGNEVTVLIQSFTKGLTPALTEIANKMADGTVKAQQYAEALGNGFGNVIKSIVDYFPTFESAMDTLNIALKTMAVVISARAIIAIVGLTKEMYLLVAGAGAATTAIGTAGLAGGMATLASAAQKLIPILGSIFYSAKLNENELADPIYTTTNALYDATEAMRNFAGTRDELDALIAKNQSVIDSAISVAAANEDNKFVYDQLIDMVAAYNGVLYTQSQALKGAAKDTDIIIEKGGKYYEWLIGISKQAKKNVEIAGWQTEAISQITEEYDLGYISLAQYEEMMRLLGVTTEKTTKKQQEQLSFLQQLIKSQAEDIKNRTDIQRALSGETTAVADLAKQYGVSEKVVRDALQSQLATMVEVVDKSVEMQDTVLTNAQIIQQGIKTAGDSLATDLATAMRKGENILDTFENAFNRMLDNILQAIIEKNITQPLIDQLIGAGDQAGKGGFLGNIMGMFGGGSGGGGFSFGGIVDGIGSFFTGLGFANGGMPPVGRASVVGERGPELFVPSGTGRIIPNDELNSGGQTANVTFNINAIDTQDAVQVLVQNRETITAIVSDSLNKRGKQGIIS